MDDELVTSTRTRAEVKAYIDGVMHARKSLARNIANHPQNLEFAVSLHTKGMEAAVLALTEVLKGVPIEEAISGLVEDIN